jgi:hypothetical protein
MSTTNATLKNDTDSDGCDNDWCDGPESETLPCFECFDPDREYDLGVTRTGDRSGAATNE